MIKLKSWRKRLYRTLIKLRGTPHGVARGVALGVALATLIPPGGHWLIGIPVALAFRANVFAFTLGTFITNPFTDIPYYYFTCRMGQLALNLMGVDVSVGGSLKEMLTSAFQMDFSGIAQELGPISACWVVGGLLVGLALSVPAYYFTYLAMIKFRQLREFRRTHRMTWLAEKLHLKRHHEASPDKGEHQS